MWSHFVLLLGLIIQYADVLKSEDKIMFNSFLSSKNYIFGLEQTLQLVCMRTTIVKWDLMGFKIQAFFFHSVCSYSLFTKIKKY